MTAESVFNSKIDEAVAQHQRAFGRAGVYGVKAKSKRCVLRCFLKVAIGVAVDGQTATGWGTRDGAQE